MALEVALMIEGQEGLDWDRWRRLAEAAETGGFHGLFRSDHLTGLFGAAERPCPLTFYHPALLAKRAAAVDVLSAGRLDLGIGAGWHEGEHQMFGIPFPALKERMDRFECGARVVKALWRGEPVTLDQAYYPLVAAQSHPRPTGVRLVIGGRGEKRTLRIVAEHADEWNTTRVTLDEYRQRRAVLEGHCRAVRRDPASIRHSLMIPVVIGRTPAELDARLQRILGIFPRVPGDAAGWKTAGRVISPGGIAPACRA